ncbi:MAG: Crp/Fnr family transcriptional regulator [Bacillota bacterium]
MNSELVLKLSQSAVFRKVRKSDLEALSKLAIKKTYQARQVICSCNDFFPYVLVVDQGCAHASMISDKGQSLIVRSLKSGDTFWGHAVIDGGPTPGTLAAAVNDTKIYLWHKNHLIPILKQNPDALWETLEVLMRRMRQAASTIDQLAFNDVLTRLANLILNEYRHAGGVAKLRRSLTLEQMAAMVNSNPEVVCRLLYRISEEEIIDINRNELLIRDVKKLQDLAGIP